MCVFGVVGLALASQSVVAVQLLLLPVSLFRRFYCCGVHLLLFSQRMYACCEMVCTFFVFAQQLIAHTIFVCYVYGRLLPDATEFMGKWFSLSFVQRFFSPVLMFATPFTQLGWVLCQTLRPSCITSSPSLKMYVLFLLVRREWCMLRVANPVNVHRICSVCSLLRVVQGGSVSFSGVCEAFCMGLGLFLALCCRCVDGEARMCCFCPAQGAASSGSGSSGDSRPDAPEDAFKQRFGDFRRAVQLLEEGLQHGECRRNIDQLRARRLPLLGLGTKAPESRVGFNVLLSVAWSLSISQGHDSLRHEGGGRARIFHQWFGCRGGRIVCVFGEVGVALAFQFVAV